LQEAKKLGVKVSANDINTKIGEIPYFRDEAGKFSPDRYKTIIANLGITSDQFEKEVGNQLKTERVINMIVAPVQVDEAELTDYFGKMKSELNLGYFVMDAGERYKNLEPSKEEIDQYYKGHTKEFDWPEMRKMKCLTLPISDFEKSVTVTDTEYKEYYDKSKERYMSTPEQGHFSHILVKLDEKAPEADVNKAKDKAKKIYDEIKAGADFGEEAKKFSDDPGSASKGGDLGFAARGSFIPEFEAAGYALSVGGVSAPVRTKFGFHIIKLEEVKPPEYQPLDKVKDEIKKDVVRNKAHVLAGEKAEKVQKECKDLGVDKAGAKNGLKVYESDWFKKREGNLEDLPESKDLTEQAFYMNQGEVSEVISGVDNLFIIQITEIKDPHQATLAEATGKIKRELKPELELKKTKEDGRKWLEEMKKGASIETEAAKAGAKVKETGFFKVGAKTIPEIGISSPSFSQMIVNLSAKNPLPDDVYDAGSKVYVFRVKADKPADMTKFSEEKDQVMEELLQKKQQVAFDKFVEDKKKGKVEIKEDLMKRIE
jgi:peptidyl-prolyl cis-trans isomerase D